MKNFKRPNKGAKRKRNMLRGGNRIKVVYGKRKL